MNGPLIAATILFFASNVFGKETWPGKPYSEVRAFVYNKRGDGYRPIINNGRLDKTVLNKPGVVLNEQDVKRLLAAVTSKRPQPKLAALVSIRATLFFL